MKTVRLLLFSIIVLGTMLATAEYQSANMRHEQTKEILETSKICCGIPDCPPLCGPGRPR
jgi:hypothetical protein